MSDKTNKAFPSGDLSSAPKGYTFYPDNPPTLAQTTMSIALDLFLVFAVGFTLFVGGKRVIAFAKRITKKRAPRVPESAASIDGTPT